MFGWHLRRSNYNPVSAQNLAQYRAKSAGDIGKEAKGEEAAVASASRTAQIVNDMQLSSLNNYAALKQMIRGEAADMLAAPPSDEPASFDWLGLAEILANNFAPYVGQYMPSLLEKAGLTATTMPTAVGISQPSQPTTSSTAVGIPQQNKDGMLKVALKLPDFVWTGENIRKTLTPYGLGDLSDEDIKALGQKLSKVKVKS
jgi:hypothetical protein